MAFFEMHFASDTLGMQCTAHVVLPQVSTSQIGMKSVGNADGCPVVYLLHGLSDDHSIWIRRTSVERYASQYGFALVIPCVHRSYYSNMQSGLRYWDFISDELPKIVGSFFKVSQDPAKTFAAGLSMGGFGALKLALNCPEKFAAAGAFSSAVRPAHLASVIPDRIAEFNSIFGSLDNIPGSINDLYHIAELRKKEGVKLPELYLACGTEDFLYQENLLFKAHLEKLGIPFAWHEEPGTHEWGFWDRHILSFFRFAHKLLVK